MKRSCIAMAVALVLVLAFQTLSPPETSREAQSHPVMRKIQPILDVFGPNSSQPAEDDEVDKSDLPEDDDAPAAMPQDQDLSPLDPADAQSEAPPTPDRMSPEEEAACISRVGLGLATGPVQDALRELCGEWLAEESVAQLACLVRSQFIDASVRGQVLDLLGEGPCEEAIAALRELLACSIAGENTPLQGALLRVLARTPRDERTLQLAGALSSASPDPDVRSNAMRLREAWDPAVPDRSGRRGGEGVDQRLD